MRVLITGGAGFIGSHLCDALASNGEQVTTVDNFTTGSIKNIAHLETKVKVVQGDIRDKYLIESLIEASDLVLHMAAALGVNKILENPVDSISTNFYGSDIILHAASKYKKQIFIASTSEIYGKNPKPLLSEGDDRVIGPPQKIRWSYSDSKALEEATAHYLHMSADLRVTTLRLFNTVGPRQTGKYGMVIPRFVSAALANEPINVYGDGTQSRVFCHVNDCVRAILTLIYSGGFYGEVFNIGGKEEISILELARIVIRLSNSNSQIKLVEYTEAYTNGYEDMQRRVPDISKIKSAIGWEPVKTLENIINDVIEFTIKET
jgi:UDP-glucose 4-epimerase